MKAAWLFALMLLCLGTLAEAQPANPRFYFPVRRELTGGGTQIVTSANGRVWAYQTNRYVAVDTAGAGIACTWDSADLYQRWYFQSDSTDTYTFMEVGGEPDTLISGMLAVPVWGSAMATARASVSATSLSEDVDGRFVPGKDFVFDRSDTLLVRYIKVDSTDAVIHVLTAMQTGNVQVDTASVITIGKDLTDYGGALSSVTLAGQVHQKIFLHADSIDAAVATFDSLSAGWTDTRGLPADVSSVIGGKPDGGEVVFMLPLTRTMIFPDNLAGSRGACLTKATGSSVFSIRSNGTQFGTCTFTDADSLGVFTTAGSTPDTLAPGDVLTIIAPAVQDATLEDIGLNLKAVRGE